MAQPTRVGTPGLLEFAVEWGPDEGDSGEQRSRGAGALMVLGRPVFGAQSAPLDWTWIELLEFLAEAWRFLDWEEVYPSGLNPTSPCRLEQDLATAREHLPPAAAAQLHDEVCSFLDHHDLGRALHGVTATPARLLRAGSTMQVAVDRTTRTVGYAEIMGSISAIGDTIAARVSRGTDARARVAADQWQTRSDTTEEFRLRFGAALTPSQWVGVRDFLPRSESAWRDDELFAAARTSGERLDGDGLHALLERLSQVRGRPTDELARLRRAVADVGLVGRPHEQGYSLATALRAALRMRPQAQQRIDIEAVVSACGIVVGDIALQTSSLDAVAVFGSRGPVVLVNSNGRHAQGARGRRATLAHELCHVLVDASGALPLAEALGGRVPRSVEQRANAFAAELLAPQGELVMATRTHRPRGRAEWVQLVNSLVRAYDASREIVCWQLTNGLDAAGEALSAPERDHLEAIGRQP